MIFTSGTQARDGRSVNHDRYPYVFNGGNRYHYIDPILDPSMWTYDPRPEFAILDNPILAHMRAVRRVSGANYFGGTAEFATDLIRSLDDGWNLLSCRATPEQIDHARRVLTRLAALGR